MLNLITLCLSLFVHSSRALDLPQPPDDYVYDETGSIDANTRQQLFQLLSNEDQHAGNQVLVAVFKSLEGEDVADYSNRLYAHWKMGQKGKDNGALLTVFLQEHRMRIEVGYGLEGVLPDALANHVIQDEMVPRFRDGQVAQGVFAGATEIIRVIHDPNAAKRARKQPLTPTVIFVGVFALIYFLSRLRSTIAYSSSGRRYYRRGGGIFWGGGGWGGGGFGGGGGFSGGGGSSGGGGASGSW